MNECMNAWIKINDILIAHGGLCSDYLDYIDMSPNKLYGDDIIKYINNKYHEYFKFGLCFSYRREF